MFDDEEVSATYEDLFGGLRVDCARVVGVTEVVLVPLGSLRAEVGGGWV